MKYRHALARLGLLLGVMLSASLSVSAWAKDVLVPGDFATIQSAIDASPSGTNIRVGPGRYVENLVIANKAITLKSSHGAAKTVLDGGHRAVVVWAQGTGKERVAITGFTITNGLNTFENDINLTSGTGGAVSVELVRATLEDNVIIGNVACIGAGVFSQEASIEVRRNQISDNSQDQSCWGANGGGIYMNGASKKDSVIADNIVSGHRIGGYGGGIGINGVKGVTISGNLIRNNSADGFGGGVYVNDSSADIKRNLIEANELPGINGSGGGLALLATERWNDIRLSENLIKGNIADYGSAALLLAYYDKAIRVDDNWIFGRGPSALIRCEAMPVKLAKGNLIVNASGPELDGSCIR